MSIIRCAKCEKIIDMDVTETEVLWIDDKEKIVCIECYCEEEEKFMAQWPKQQ